MSSPIRYWTNQVRRDWNSGFGGLAVLTFLNGILLAVAVTGVALLLIAGLISIAFAAPMVFAVILAVVGGLTLMFLRIVGKVE